MEIQCHIALGFCFENKALSSSRKDKILLTIQLAQSCINFAFLKEIKHFLSFKIA